MVTFVSRAVVVFGVDDFLQTNLSFGYIYGKFLFVVVFFRQKVY